MKAGIMLEKVAWITRRGEKGGFVHACARLCMKCVHTHAHTKPQVSGGFLVFVHGRVRGVFWCVHM